MNFADLPVGAKFRFWRRGTLLTKTSKNAYTAPMTGLAEKAAPDAQVLPEGDDEPAAEAAPPADPFGARNRVDFQLLFKR